MAATDPATEDILRLSLRHNFWTWSAQAQVDPIPVVRAEGVYFWDAQGTRYLDLNSMTMCVNIGHGDARVIEAMVAQARALPYAAPGMATGPRAVIGRLLAEITPGDLNRFFYTLGGAEANENAIKIARAYTGRHKILARYGSYHGATHGAMAATGDFRRWVWEPMLMPGVVHLLEPHRSRSPFHRRRPEVTDEVLAGEHLEYLEQTIRLEGAETIAAVLIEPVTGANGVVVPPPGYLQGVRELCDRYGILLICDEVMSGFGRTGAWFAVDHWGVVPDLITMAKGLTSGYAPLGAVAMRDSIADFFRERVYQGGLTYNGHPVCLAAAIANIGVLREDRLVERSKEMGPVLARHLGELARAHPSVGEVRSIGLFGAIEFVRDRSTGEPLTQPGQPGPETKALQRTLRRRGVYVQTHGSVLLIIPPLIITEDQLAEGLAAVSAAIAETVDGAVR